MIDLRRPKERPVGRARRWSAALAVLAATLGGTPVHAQEEPGVRYRILAAHSADPDLPSFLAIDQATRDEIRARLGPALRLQPATRRVTERLLPDGCELSFPERSPWALYRWQILAAVALVLAQSALIVALLLLNRGRRRAELAVQRQRVELAHASRLAAAGELTAAIAHEVRQPLAAILANVGAAEMLLKAGEVRIDELRQILAELRRDDLRANEVIQRLQMLLSKHEMSREPVDMNATIADVLRLLEADASRRGVALVGELDPTIPRALGDRVHLQQVLLNLVINAMDAMADTPVPMRRVVVRTSRSERGVQVAVTDRGHGIAPERLPRLFESFFTTKEKGMGLGLSIAKSIVDAHGGRIWAEAADGGATFRFAIPGEGAWHREPVPLGPQADVAP